MLLYSNDFYSVHFVKNGTHSKDHDIQKQFAIVNLMLGTVEVEVSTFPHSVQYADQLALEWVRYSNAAKGKFNPEVQGLVFEQQVEKEVKAGQPKLTLVKTDSEE